MILLYELPEMLSTVFDDESKLIQVSKGILKIDGQLYLTFCALWHVRAN